MSEREIIIGMDAFALELLKQAREQTEGLADRLATFKEIGRWVSIKHGLEDSDGSEGVGLRDLKSRLKGDDDRRTRGQPRTSGPLDGRRHNGNADNFRPDKSADADLDDPDLGTGLAAIRAKLPTVGNRPDNRRFRRIGSNSGSAPFAAAGGSGSVPADLSGTANTEPNVAGNSADVRPDGVSAPDLPVRAEGLGDAG